MGQKSGQRTIQPRIPSSFQGIDVNRCPLPSCANFNKEGSPSRNDPCYTISGNKRNGSSIQCKQCNGFYSIKSNRAIFEEVRRLEYLEERSNVYRQDGTACHNLSCVNFGKRVALWGELYKRNGKTPAGNQRFKCLSCNTTFTANSEKRKNHPDNKSHQNSTLFRLLVNNMSINRIIEITNLSAPTIYRKINMFYERCVSFSYHREQALNQMSLGLLRLSTDRQEYHVNWTNRKDKKNVVMTAIGTADKASRYVFGMDVNYDPSISLTEVRNNPYYQQDASLKDYNRHFARLWTERDIQSGKAASQEYSERFKELLKRYSTYPLPISEIGFSYFIEQLALEYGIEPVEHNQTTQLPKNGCQVHSEYTMYAHFHRLHSLIGHAEALRFYLDQEPAINRACNLAFSNNVRLGNFQSLYVRINKTLTVDDRRALVKATQSLVQQVQIEQGLSEQEARKLIAMEALQHPVTFNGKSEQWYALPLDKIYECEKHVSFLTPTDNLRGDSKAIIFLDASLHPIDNFFQVVRRRLSGLERPISTSSNAGRVWTGKSPYNPAMINKLLQILRVYYNYCFVSKKDNKTAAERIGLAKGSVEIRKILYP